MYDSMNVCVHKVNAYLVGLRRGLWRGELLWMLLFISSSYKSRQFCLNRFPLLRRNEFN